MANTKLAQKLSKLSRDEHVAAVTVRREGRHFRATSGGGWHVVKQIEVGVCGCSCKDFEFQHGPASERCCKHMWAMFKLGLIGLTCAQIAAWNARVYASERGNTPRPAAPVVTIGTAPLTPVAT